MTKIDHDMMDAPQVEGPDVSGLLRRHGLRPTRQRLALGALLFGQCRHITAERLHAEALAAGAAVSLATVYNTLHQFTEAGLLREIVADPNCSYFDTNITDHHHFFFTKSGRLEDIPEHLVEVAKVPSAPEGMTIERVDVIVRITG